MRIILRSRGNSRVFFKFQCAPTLKHNNKCPVNHHVFKYLLPPITRCVYKYPALVHYHKSFKVKRRGYKKG